MKSSPSTLGLTLLLATVLYFFSPALVAKMLTCFAWGSSSTANKLFDVIYTPAEMLYLNFSPYRQLMDLQFEWLKIP